MSKLEYLNLRLKLIKYAYSQIFLGLTNTFKFAKEILMRKYSNCCANATRLLVVLWFCGYIYHATLCNILKYLFIIFLR